MQAWAKLFLLKPAFIQVQESEATMKIPYGYVLVNQEITIRFYFGIGT